KGVGGTFTHFAVGGVDRQGKVWKVDCGDEVAVFQDGVVFGVVSGQAVQSGHGDSALSFGSEQTHFGAQCGQGHRHVGRVGGHALLGGAQHGVVTPVAVLGRTTTAGLALVTGGGGVLEVRTAGALKQVAAGGGGVAQLPGGPGEQGHRQGRVAASHERVSGQVTVGHGRTNTQASIGKFLDGGVQGRTHVHDVLGAGHTEFEVVD